MSDDKANQKSNGWIVTIAVALIGLIGTVVGNWDRLPFGKASKTVEPTTSSSPNPLNQPQKTNPSPTHMEKYEYITENGRKRAFVRLSDNRWQEKDEFEQVMSSFNEIERDSEFITIYDPVRVMKIRIPIAGGQTILSWKERDWADVPFYDVRKKL
ncbi:hypothetical protein [Phormidesmis priestleyi]